MKAILFILAILFSISSYGQHVQWASKLVSFTSNLSGEDYDAFELLGEPDGWFEDGKSKRAWMPSKANSTYETFIVQFDEPIHVKQILILENMNPGAIWKVHLFKEGGLWERGVYKNKKHGPLDEEKRALIIEIPKTSYRAIGLQVEMRCDRVPGTNQIDAIAISDSDQPIEY